MSTPVDEFVINQNKWFANPTWQSPCGTVMRTLIDLNTHLPPDINGCQFSRIPTSNRCQRGVSHYHCVISCQYMGEPVCYKLPLWGNMCVTSYQYGVLPMWGICRQISTDVNSHGYLRLTGANAGYISLSLCYKLPILWGNLCVTSYHYGGTCVLQVTNMGYCQGGVSPCIPCVKKYWNIRSNYKPT